MTLGRVFSLNPWSPSGKQDITYIVWKQLDQACMRCTAEKIVKGFGTENPEIAPLAGNGKRVGSDKRTGTLVLDDNDANEPEECAAASRGKGHMWGRRNSFFLPQNYRCTLL
ncbi:hypothetical protein OG21DRAFT_1607654 [Imleria badia]|nr:hypothetical protein OG21DRAFT_1607654 [Imleria badia]